MKSETQDLAVLLKIPRLKDFIAESYRRILLREPDFPGALRIARRLRFLPFYSRRRFLQRLVLSEEYRLLLQTQKTQIEEQQRLLNEDRSRFHRECQEFQFQRQIQEKKTIDDQKERKQWQEIETLLLTEHTHLLYLEDIESFVRESYQQLVGRAPSAEELSNGGDRLRGGVDRLKRDFLRRLLANGLMARGQTQVSSSSSLRPSHRLSTATPKEPKTCRICDGPLVYKWSLNVMLDKFVADYYECSNCRALQIPQPYWLDEAYQTENKAALCNPDRGRFIRNFSAYCYVVALHKAGLFADHPLFLDFGGGYGVLTQMFRDANYEAYQSDPYVDAPFLASDRFIQDLQAIPDATFDMVSALEVLEHLTDPHQVFARLRRILKPDGTLVLSTAIYQPDVMKSDWEYLGKEWGQHVTFWSQSAIRHCAGRYGFQTVGYFPGHEGFLIVLTNLKPEVLKSKLTRAAALLQDEHRIREAIGPWDFLNRGFVRMRPEPLVQEAAEILALQGSAA